MLIKNKKIRRLSNDVRKLIDGQNIDIRSNREGIWGILLNDIHMLARLKNEQVDALHSDREKLKNSLADISHQLKTPLTSMMIMADLLENAPHDKQSEFIENIKTELVRMEWLVTAILKMAKLDTGAIEFNLTNISAANLVQIALEPLQILLDIKKQNVIISCDTDIFCDKKWTAEALSNVIKNASEYSPDNSIIKIESGANPICKWISVTDSGNGISNTDIAKIFRRFEGSRSDKGYGIGLPLALSIMRGQNGDIEVDGGCNRKGAAFTLKFYK